MKSSNVLESLRDSLKNYIVSNYSGQVPDICELYPLDLNMLDDRSDIPGIRIGIYEQSDDPSVIASDTNVLDTLQIRSEEHTSELQSRFDLVCRLLLEK